MDSYPIFTTPGSLVTMLVQGSAGIILILATYLLFRGLGTAVAWTFYSIKTAIKTRKHEKRVWNAIFANGEEIIAELDAEEGLELCGSTLPSPALLKPIEWAEIKATSRPPEDFTGVPKKEAIQFVDEYCSNNNKFFSAPSGTGKSEVGFLKAQLRDKEIYTGHLKSQVDLWKAIAEDRHDKIEELEKKLAGKEEQRVRWMAVCNAKEEELAEIKKYSYRKNVDLTD
jgi:hypothetical protein